jgi:carbamoyl-phosphate synthase small subunit
MIGNYGANLEDMESSRPWLSVLIVRELSVFPSNYRSESSFPDFLAKHGVTVLSGIDTRALTRRLRDHGTMNGLVTFQKPGDASRRLDEIKKYSVRHSVIRVSRKHPETFGTGRRKVALVDYGAKQNIIRSLVARDCTVTVWPWDTPAYIILDSKPDGIMLSNGPGDPKECSGVLGHLRELMDSGIPLFAICLGHQLLALASGFDTTRLKFGHRGANHPVKDLETGRVYMSSQNHGYCVCPETVDPVQAEISHINVNDGTVEGLRFKNRPVSSVQFHPEASPGPRETAYLFDNFMQTIDATKGER